MCRTPTTCRRCPGSGYLKFGTDEMTRFKAAYVSGRLPHRRGRDRSAGQLPVDRRPGAVHRGAGAGDVRRPGPGGAGSPQQPDDDALADTVLDVIVRRLEGQGPPAHQVWLPPLDEAPAAGPAAAGARRRRRTAA